MDNKLSEDQLNRAIQAFKSQDRAFTGSVGAGLCLAAPFLQLPWSEPTGSELAEAWSAIAEPSMTSGTGWKGNWHDACREWVRRRNAQLLPPPIDPRHQVVLNALLGFNGMVNLDQIAASILAALDNQSKKDHSNG